MRMHAIQDQLLAVDREELGAQLGAQQTNLRPSRTECMEVAAEAPCILHLASMLGGLSKPRRPPTIQWIRSVHR